MVVLDRNWRCDAGEIDLADGQRTTANFTLSRGSAITGRVSDEFGDPITGARVQVLRSQVQQGRRRLVPATGGAQTDDTGSFRVFGLAPGEYYVSASLQAAPADFFDAGEDFRNREQRFDRRFLAFAFDQFKERFVLGSIVLNAEALSGQLVEQFGDGFTLVQFDMAGPPGLTVPGLFHQGRIRFVFAEQSEVGIFATEPGQVLLGMEVMDGLVVAIAHFDQMARQFLGPGVAVFDIFAEVAAVPADRLFVLPAGFTTRQGAAMMLQGLTAHYLACSTYPLKSGDACLVHAGAGGVGLLLCQIAKLRGARVIGTVSTDEKAKLAREAGADEVILYTKQDFVAEVKRLTGGKGLQVVYDAVGKDTFDKGFDCLVPRGMMVLYGASSGPVGPFDLQVLNAKGSIFVTRPSLNHHIASREELLQRTGELSGWIRDGKVKLRMEFEFPLKDAAEAHRALEGRRTTGKVLLVP